MLRPTAFANSLATIAALAFIPCRILVVVALLGTLAAACAGGGLPVATTAPAGSTAANGEHVGMPTTAMADEAGNVQIVEPVDGATLPAGSATVRAQVQGTPSGEDVHWHLWVDGELAGMISGLETEIELAPGEHELQAAISSAVEHEEDPDTVRSIVHVTVTP